MVDADKMLPERLTTTSVTSSGFATPSLDVERSRGFRASKPALRSSFSKVLITRQTSGYCGRHDDEQNANLGDS